MSQAIIKKERKVIIIQGYYNNDNEFELFSSSRRLIAQYFASITGGAFDRDEIIQITNNTHSLSGLNDAINNLTADVAIYVFIGHGAIQDGNQLFQFNENEVFLLGQLNYKARKTLILVNSCRGQISGYEVEMIAEKIPSFIEGGKMQEQITREAAKSMYNKAIGSVNDGMTICFSCSEGEISFGGQFLYSLVKKSYNLGAESNKVTFISDLIPKIHQELSSRFEYSQHPVIVSTNTDFPIALPIYKNKGCIYRK